MKLAKTKLSTLLLSLALMLGLIVVFSVNTKVYADHWADEQISKWQSQNLLSAEEVKDFRADDNITRVEFMDFINRMQEFTEKSDDISQYTDVQQTDAYYDTVSIALKAGYIKGISDTEVAPNALITREQAMAIFSRISETTKNTVAYKNAKDYQEVSPWAVEAVSTSINEGFISGYDNKIMPLANMTRAEALVMLNRKLEDTRIYALAGDYDLNNEAVKNIEILADGVSLKNAKVKENLTVDKKVADGEIHLKNIAVSKNLYAYGGGEHSLYFNSVRVDGSLIVKKENGKIRIVADGETKSNVTVLKSGAILVNQTKNGKAFERVEIPKELIESSQIELVGDFNKVENNAEDAEIKLDGELAELDLKADATLSGDATIKDVQKSSAVKLTVEDKNGKEKVVKGSVDSLVFNDKGLKATGSNSPRQSSNDDKNDGGSKHKKKKHKKKKHNYNDNNSNNSSSNENYIDPRFVDGYPKAVVNSNGKVDVYLKLKEDVSEPTEAFVTIYNDFDYRCHIDEIGKAEVFHGMEARTSLYGRDSYYTKLEAGQECIIKTEKSSDGVKMVYIVLRANEEVLGEVSKIIYTKEEQDEIHPNEPDTKAPEIMTLNSKKTVYINNNKDKIYLYFNEALDDSAIPLKEAFTLSNGTIEAVKFKEDIFYHNKKRILELSVSSINDLSSLTISYNKDSATNMIMDKVGNKAESFNSVVVSEPAKLKITDVKVFPNMSGMQCTLKDGDCWYSDIKGKIELDSSEIGHQSHVRGRNHDLILTFDIDQVIQQTDGFKIVLELENNEKFVDLAFDEYSTIEFDKDNTVEYIEAVELKEGNLKFKNGKIELAVTKGKISNHNEFGTLFAIKIDDKIYRLQVANAIKQSSNIDICGDASYYKDDYNYYKKYIVPIIEEALNDGKTVKLIYDTRYCPNDSQEDIIRTGITPYIEYGQSKEWTVVK